MKIFGKLKTYAIITLIFACAGASTRPLVKIADSAQTEKISAQTLRAAVGAGAVFGVLGGYASLAADFAWIKSYVEWTRKDLAACTASMSLAVSLDPYMKQFWRDGAAIIAFDFPHWLLARQPADLRVPQTLMQLKMRQGKEGIKFIDRGLKIFPHDTGLLIQKASIAMANLDDYKIAEKCYAILAAEKDAPIYVLRRYAAILMRNGKFADALKVMETMLPEIPLDSPLRNTIIKQIESARKLLEKTKS